MKLDKKQLSFFDTFGFLNLRGLFANSINSIIQEFENVFHQSTEVMKMENGVHAAKRVQVNAEMVHDGKSRTCVTPFIDMNEHLCSLLDDPRMEGAIASLLGDDFNYTGSDGNYYTGHTDWHRDSNEPGVIQSVKAAFYLDHLTGATGALRVIPGSHHLEINYFNDLKEKMSRSTEEWGISGADIPAQALDVVPGDLLLFDSRILHSSWGGTNSRRMFTMNFANRYPDDQLDTLSKNIARHAAYHGAALYGETIIKTASPQRMKHLEQYIRVGGEHVSPAR